MAKQPNNEAATVLSDILCCPGKGGGAVGLAVPLPPGVELFPWLMGVPLSEGNQHLYPPITTFLCDCSLGSC